MKLRPIVLIIMDGWGLSPAWGGNALAMNNPKNIDYLWRSYPHAVLQALGAVSDEKLIAESRLGHTLIGTGRLAQGNYSRIQKEIKSRRFYKNQILQGAIEWTKRHNSNIHFLGMISGGGVHSHFNHLLALLTLAERANFHRVYIDAITDGTDSGPADALGFIEKIQNKMDEIKIGEFSSISGRYFAMDRDEHWEEINKYYEVLTSGKGKNYPSIQEAVTENYRKGNNDEFIIPGLIKQKNNTTVKIKNNDAVVFFNFREDRARELTRVFLDKNLRKVFWKPKQLDDLYFATFIDYQKNIPAKIVFPDVVYEDTLSEAVSKMNLHQLKIAESEKYAHVTYFFNGGQEDPFPGEERKIISSPPVKTYDQVPEMSARKVTQTVINAIKSKHYDLIVVNFANVDMLAHTGNILAVGQAVQIVDRFVGQITEVNLKNGGATLITADHGNAEQMVKLTHNVSHDRETLHTLNPVPFILITPKNKKNLLQSAIGHDPSALAKIIQAKDTLADVAPTILELMQIPKPSGMTGHSLLKRLE